MIVTAFYVLWQTRQLLLLIFTAIVLATALSQLVRQLQRFRLPRTPAVLLGVSIVLALLVDVTWLIVPPFVEQFQELIRACCELLNLEAQLLPELAQERTARGRSIQACMAYLPPFQSTVPCFQFTGEENWQIKTINRDRIAAKKHHTETKT